MWHVVWPRWHSFLDSLSWESPIVLRSVVHLKNYRNSCVKNKVQALAPFSPSHSWQEVGVNVRSSFSESYRDGWKQTPSNPWSERCGGRELLKLFNHLTSTSHGVYWQLKEWCTIKRVYLWSKKRNFHSRLCLEVNSSLGSSTVHISYEYKNKNNRGENVYWIKWLIHDSENVILLACLSVCARMWRIPW